jgi:hypothetical protein
MDGFRKVGGRSEVCELSGDGAELRAAAADGILVPKLVSGERATEQTLVRIPDSVPPNSRLTQIAWRFPDSAAYGQSSETSTGISDSEPAEHPLRYNAGRKYSL